MSVKTSGSSEIKPLTSLRGIAATLVVLFHFRREFGNTIALDHVTGFFQKGYLWVDFFFILSGFVLGLVHGEEFRYAKSWNNYRTFLAKRLGRIYPLHIFTLLLFVPTEAAKMFLHSNAAAAFSNNTPFSFLTNVFLLQTWHFHPSLTWNQPSWSISAEWAAYLLFPWIASAILNCRPVHAVFVGAGLLGGTVMLALFGGHGNLDIMQDYGVIRCLLSFSLGLLVFRWHSETPASVRQLICNEISLALALLAIVACLHLRVFDPVAILLFVWLVAAASSGDGRIHRLLSGQPFYFLGVISYSIYMDQALVERAWQFAWDRWASKSFGPVQSSITMAIMLGVVFIFAYATYRLVEMPWRRKLPRLLDAIRLQPRSAGAG